MVIPVMSGASLTSSVVAKPSADAVSLPEVLLSAVASEVLSLSAVLSETDVLSVWLSETSAADAVDVLLSETAEVPDADDVPRPADNPPPEPPQALETILRDISIGESDADDAPIVTEQILTSGTHFAPRSGRLSMLFAWLRTKFAARKAAEERFEACRKEQIALEAGAKQLEAQLAGGEEIDEKAQRQQGNALAVERLSLLERQRTLHSRANTNKTALASVRNKSDELERLEREYSWLSMLSQTANGTLSGKDKITLETYIQMTFFDRILQRANGRLLVMSGGQYELKRRSISDNRQSKTGLELDVIDHYNGSERSVKSLSGGESFKASLSLALGLSDEVQSAAAAGIRLDTMFVDEGFGSLDEESLAQAIHALSSLAEGKRLVGIISHVSELKERIDRQIIVAKDPDGSSHAELIV